MTELMKAEVMTSREIAELTGKRHADVLEAIRTMEPAWVKVNGRSFPLVEYVDAKGEKRPMYSLTKTECLYIATKFNDEARAKLVIRWEELELQHRQSAPALPQTYLEALKALVASEEARIEAEKKNAVLMHVRNTYTATEIAKELGMPSASALNKALAEKHIQYKVNGNWVFYSKYSGMGYEHIKQEVLDNGHVVYYRRFTQEGRDFLLNLFAGKK